MTCKIFKKAAFAALLNLSIVQAQPFFNVGSGTNSAVESLYADTANDILYAGGYFTQAGNLICKYIATWDGTVWDSTRNQLLQQSVRSIEKFNNEIYIAGSIGWYDSLGNIIAPLVAKWDSLTASWVNFGANANNGTQKVYSYNNSLYIMGNFDSIGGIYSSKIARYDGINWYSFPTLDNVGFAIFNAMFYSGELYVGGNFDSQIASNMKDLAKWDGSQWLSVGGGLSGIGNVTAFTIYQGKLIVAGYFNTAWGDPGNNIAAWDGSQWTQLGTGLDNSGQVHCLTVYNNELWAGGAFYDAGGIPVTFLAKWDGTQWYSLGITLDNIVISMTVLGNDLYIGGAFWTMDGDSVNRIIRYNYLTGFESLEPKENEIEINPNPTTGTLHVKNFNSLKLKNIFIYDTLGEKVKTFKVEKSIFIGNLPKGLYLVQLRNDSGIIYSQKIILQ